MYLLFYLLIINKIYIKRTQIELDKTLYNFKKAVLNHIDLQHLLDKEVCILDGDGHVTAHIYRNVLDLDLLDFLTADVQKFSY